MTDEYVIEIINLTFLVLSFPFAVDMSYVNILLTE